MAQATMALLAAPAFTPTSTAFVGKTSFTGVSLPLLRSPVVRRAAGIPGVVALFKKETAKKILLVRPANVQQNGLITSGLLLHNFKNIILTLTIFRDIQLHMFIHLLSSHGVTS